MRLDPEIAFCLAVFTGPTPYLVEHAAVQPAHEAFVQNIPFALKCPTVRFRDVLLFEFV